MSIPAAPDASTANPECSACPTCGAPEVWRPVRGYEDLYEVSSSSRVRSLDRVRSTGRGLRRVRGRILGSPRIVLSTPGGVRYVDRRILLSSTFGSAPAGAVYYPADGDSAHECASNLGWAFPALGYRAMHQKVQRIRGLASQYACIDCAGPALDWSYTNSGYCESLQDIRGSEVAYSLDPAEYEPRCRPCHRRFDGAGISRTRNPDGTWTTKWLVSA